MQVPDGGYPETGGLFDRDSFHGQFTAPAPGHASAFAAAGWPAANDHSTVGSRGVIAPAIDVQWRLS